MARTSDWVQEQSAEDQTPRSDSETHDAQPVTPPPRNLDQEGRDNGMDRPPIDPPARPSLSTPKYDIATLLSLRHTQGAVPVMLRVKPEAIAENIFQYMGASTSRRMPTRSRGLSDISNASRGSINAHSNIGHRATFDSKYPSLPKLQRQAPSPLDIPLSQRNDGFVRFLQQHASPPHHRVTAGGRIVPAGPTSPPPMLDYGSLNGLVRERAEAAEASHNKGGSVLSGFKPGNTNSAAMPLNNSHFYLPQGNGTSSQSGYPGNHIQPAIPHENLAYGYQPFMTPTIQSPAAFEPMGNFSDGSAFVSCNGVYYRAYLNGMNTIMEPLRSTQLPMEQTDYTGTHLQVPSNVTPYNIPASSPQGPNSYVPLANITNGSWGSNRKTSDNTSTSSSPNKEAELKSQLTDLDKHLALNHFEILPLERAEFVARRRYLVEAIDKIRVANEKAKRSIPIIVPATGLPITPLQMPTFERKDNVSKPPGLRGATSHVQASGKGLSPAAAPFVPSNVRNVRNISSENSTKRTLEEVTNAAIARKDNARNTYDPSGSTQVNSRREVSSSSVLDPSDPAMRVIDHGDIEYAGRYLFNSGFEKKTYCTTVAEFQEAIRQTREQARRHGCLGGSSKDPAYDAEQDIWWAICDRDPIPLPPSVPEYLANPRPWNWQDSIFNMRRKGAPLEGINCDKARNSPRLAGWDPALTEKTKDIIDVSRSYYAFKGMLPSVPFRTWAYDRYGNKVAIESTPDSDTQRGFQSRSISSPVDCTETTTRPKALKSLSKNEINSRDATPRIGSRVKDGRKMHVTEGDSVPRSKSKALDETSPTFRLGMGFERSLTSHVAKNGADDADILKRSKTTSSSYQPYAEDYPETPAKNRSGQQSIEVPTPKAEPVCTSINGTTNSRMSAVETKFLAESSRDPWASSRHLGDMWDSYDSWDPIWMGDYPIDHPKNPIMRERALLSLGEQSAQTKSQWGPEEDSQSLVRFNYPRNQFSEGMPTNKIKTAKVNIPFAGNSHSPLESHHEIHKAKPIISTTSESPGAQNFLRKMLQSPTYATARPPAGTASNLAERLTKFLRGKGEGAQQGNQRPGNKENAPSNSSAGPVERVRIGHLSLTSGFKSDPDISVTKAQSSLASSYQAHNSLSHNDDAGKTHTGWPYDGWGNDFPTLDQQQYAPGRSAALTDRDGPSTYDALASHHVPASFGYDGGADPPLPSKAQDLKAAQEAHPNFDYKGVSHADYEINREDPNSGWHKGAVEDYFQDLAARQRKEVSSHQQSSSKRGT